MGKTLLHFFKIILKPVPVLFTSLLSIDTRTLDGHERLDVGDSGHEQLILNGGRFKPDFAERDKK
jgi:hypothetical protein